MSSPVFTPPPPTPPPIEACYFYHTTTIPGRGTVTGEWDLAPGIDAYLGHVPFAGKSVLDVGAATGFLTFHMEKAGGIGRRLRPLARAGLGRRSALRHRRGRARACAQGAYRGDQQRLLALPRRQ